MTGIGQCSLPLFTMRLWTCLYYILARLQSRWHTLSQAFKLSIIFSLSASWSLITLSHLFSSSTHSELMATNMEQPTHCLSFLTISMSYAIFSFGKKSWCSLTGSAILARADNSWYIQHCAVILCLHCLFNWLLYLSMEPSLFTKILNTQKTELFIARICYNIRFIKTT